MPSSPLWQPPDPVRRSQEVVVAGTTVIISQHSAYYTFGNRVLQGLLNWKSCWKKDRNCVWVHLPTLILACDSRKLAGCGGFRQGGIRRAQLWPLAPSVKVGTNNTVFSWVALFWTHQSSYAMFHPTINLGDPQVLLALGPYFENHCHIEIDF